MSNLQFDFSALIAYSNTSYRAPLTHPIREIYRGERVREFATHDTPLTATRVWLMAPGNGVRGGGL